MILLPITTGFAAEGCEFEEFRASVAHTLYLAIDCFGSDIICDWNYGAAPYIYAESNGETGLQRSCESDHPDWLIF